MEFIVPAELNPQNQWQIELMIEGFKVLGLQDKLVVCLATDDPKSFIPEMTKNLSAHRNVMLIRNHGAARGFEPLNRLYGVRAAILDGRVGETFFVLEPDMVPCRVPTVDTSVACCTYQFDPNFFLEVINVNTPTKRHFGFEPGEVGNDSWACAGPLMCFHGFPVEFFEEVIKESESYVYRQFYDTGSAWDRSVQSATNMVMHRHLGRFTARALYDMECNLMSDRLATFIHYETGFPPLFTKSMFPYSSPQRFSLGNPFKTLSQYAPTQPFQYLSQIATQYLRG